MRILTTVALCAVACGQPVETRETSSGDEVTSEPVEEPVSEPVSDASIAEVPFPATEIRRATQPGRTYVVELREGDADPQREVWTFEESRDDGFLLVVRDPEGAELRRSEGPWTELESHAHFPAALTTIESAPVSTELGDFVCRLYTVRDPDDANMVRRFWFADELPGAPIRMVVERMGRTLMEMRIVEHRPGT